MKTEFMPVENTSRSKVGKWIAGLLLLAGLIVVASHFGELKRFLELLKQANPAWLMVAALLQLGTYTCVAGVWYLALRKEESPQSLYSLIPVAVAKLFSDQAVPSGGVSGIAFFVAALNRRGVAPGACMATLLLNVVSYYMAYLSVAALSVLLLWFYHAIHAWIIGVVCVFSVVAVGIPALAFWLRSVESAKVPPLLLRMPGLSRLMDATVSAPAELLQNPALVLTAFILTAAVFLLDAATLWIMMILLGVETSYLVVFPSFVVASMVATVSPIPLGLGSFEAACVGLLVTLAIPVETALTATLLLRGFTLWLPMLPGMWFARRALR